MKYAFTLTTIFAAFTTAQACPELTGSYLCSDPRNTYNMSVTQRIDGNTHIYKIDYEGGSPYELITDGVTRTEIKKDQDGTTAKYDISVTCKNSESLEDISNMLVQDSTGTITIQNKYTELTTKTTDGLIFEGSSEDILNGGQEQFTTQCQRL